MKHIVYPLKLQWQIQYVCVLSNLLQNGQWVDESWSNFPTLLKSIYPSPWKQIQQWVFIIYKSENLILILNYPKIRISNFLDSNTNNDFINFHICRISDIRYPICFCFLTFFSYVMKMEINNLLLSAYTMCNYHNQLQNNKDLPQGFWLGDINMCRKNIHSQVVDG